MGAGASLGGANTIAAIALLLCPFWSPHECSRRVQVRDAHDCNPAVLALDPCASSDAQHERRCCTQVQRSRR